MAYFNQERKKERAPKIQAILKKYNVKGTLKVRSHSTLVLTLKKGQIDFLDSFVKTTKPNKVPESINVNPYWYSSHFDGKALDFLNEVIPEMYGKDYYDHSDIQTDYFNCSHYIDINIGTWDKPYVLE